MEMVQRELSIFEPSHRVDDVGGQKDRHESCRFAETTTSTIGESKDVHRARRVDNTVPGPIQAHRIRASQSWKA